jgi:hypothetical protein
VLVVFTALALLVLAAVTTRGLYQRERTPLPALACAAGAVAFSIGLVRIYLTAVAADEQNTRGTPSTGTLVLLVSGVVAVLVLHQRLRRTSRRPGSRSAGSHGRVTARRTLKMVVGTSRRRVRWPPWNV